MLLNLGLHCVDLMGLLNLCLLLRLYMVVIC